MDVLVQFRQRVNESEIEFEKTVTITDDLTMGQLERHCLFLMGDWKYIRNGLISYSRKYFFIKINNTLAQSQITVKIH